MKLPRNKTSDHSLLSSQRKEHSDPFLKFFATQNAKQRHKREMASKPIDIPDPEQTFDFILSFFFK